MSGNIEQLDVEWPQALQLAGGGARRVWVWLPEGYQQSQTHYPVLFMHDGQNVLRDADATFGTCWSMIEAQLRLSQPMIVVAIEGQNEAIARFNEFSPWTNSNLSHWKQLDGSAGGLADTYLDFVCHTLVPVVHHRYRCDVRPEQNYLGGSSMGGLVTLYATTRFEHLFGKYMAMSTATWFAHDALLSALSRHPFQAQTRVYCDVGTQETSLPSLREFPEIYVTGNKEMAAVLSKQLPPNQLRFSIEPDACHNESAWSQRLPAALAWLSQ